jgi:hypothetical protein
VTIIIKTKQWNKIDKQNESEKKIGTFLGAVRVPSISNKALKPGFLMAIPLNIFFCHTISTISQCFQQKLNKLVPLKLSGKKSNKLQIITYSCRVGRAVSQNGR